jgi:hypothetical protein
VRRRQELKAYEDLDIHVVIFIADFSEGKEPTSPTITNL